MENYTVTSFVTYSTSYIIGSLGRDGSVGIATEPSAGQSGDIIPVGVRFSAPVQTDPGAHPASYTMGTRFFPEGKAAGAWHCPPTPSSAEV